MSHAINSYECVGIGVNPLAEMSGLLPSLERPDVTSAETAAADLVDEPIDPELAVRLELAHPAGSLAVIAELLDYREPTLSRSIPKGQPTRGELRREARREASKEAGKQARRLARTIAGGEETHDTSKPRGARFWAKHGVRSSGVRFETYGSRRNDWVSRAISRMNREDGTDAAGDYLLGI